jgi:hypothetical protein
MIALHINCKRLDKAHFISGENGALYADLLLFENKTPDKYGNAGFVVQGVGKDVRERGERGPIVGNWKHIGQKPAAPAKTGDMQGEASGDDLPF